MLKAGVKTTEAMRSERDSNQGMKSINVEMLLGHDIGVSGHFYRPAESDILEDYMTYAADALTIDPTQRLKQENAELKKTQSDYLADVGDLRHDFNEMKQLPVHLSKENQPVSMELVWSSFKRLRIRLISSGHVMID